MTTATLPRHEALSVEFTQAVQEENGNNESLDRLQKIRDAGLFLGSIWAYGLEEGEPLSRAPILWMPSKFTIDSGRLAVIIDEWCAVSIDEERSSKRLIKGSGELEETAEGKSLLMGIFQTMTKRGTARLVSTPVSTTLAEEASPPR